MNLYGIFFGMVLTPSLVVAGERTALAIGYNDSVKVDLHLDIRAGGTGFIFRANFNVRSFKKAPLIFSAVGDFFEVETQRYLNGKYVKFPATERFQSTGMGVDTLKSGASQIFTCPIELMYRYKPGLYRTRIAVRISSTKRLREAFSNWVYYPGPPSGEQAKLQIRSVGLRLDSCVPITMTRYFELLHRSYRVVCALNSTMEGGHEISDSSAIVAVRLYNSSFNSRIDEDRVNGALVRAYQREFERLLEPVLFIKYGLATGKGGAMYLDRLDLALGVTMEMRCRDVYEIE